MNLKYRLTRAYCANGLFHIIFFGPIFVFMIAMIFTMEGNNPTATEKNLCQNVGVMECSRKIITVFFADNWTPPVGEPIQTDKGCKIKREWCA